MADISERLRHGGSWEPTTLSRTGKKIWLGLHEGDMREAAEELDRLQEAKRHALALADAKGEENVELRAALREALEIAEGNGEDFTWEAAERLRALKQMAQ